MTIAYFVDGLNRGGVEVVVSQLANSFSRLGHEVHVVCMFHDKREMVPELSEAVSIHYLPFDSCKSHYVQYLRYLPCLKRLLKEINPSVIHAHNFSFSYFFLSIAILLSRISTQNIRSIHFAGFFLERRTVVDRLRFFFDYHASRLLRATIISVSPTVAAKVVDLYPANRHLTITNGIDTEGKFSKKNITKSSLGIDEKRLVVAYVSRICAGKNHETLLRAWEKVVKEEPSALLILIGDGPLREYCQSIIRSKGLENSLLFTGSLPHVEKYLSIADIGVFPSESEGLGLGLLEMMSMQLPVVASRIPAFYDIIQENTTGILFNTFDSDELACKILALLSNRNLRAQLGNNARGYVQQHYSFDGMIAQHKAAYDND